MEMAGKKTNGIQKIEIKRIEDEDYGLVTFSKRRSGVYKKARELATLCGAEVAGVVFSPTGKAFSIGRPSVESVANRLLNQNPLPDDSTHPLEETHRRVRTNELDQHYTELVRQLEAERERGKALQKLTQETGAEGWSKTPLEGLSFEELQHRYALLQDIYTNLLKSMKEKLAAGTPSSSFAVESSVEENSVVPNASGTHRLAFLLDNRVSH